MSINERIYSEKDRFIGQKNYHGIIHWAAYNMGEIYNSQKKYDHAIIWYQRALNGYENEYGMNHLNTVNLVYSIAGIYLALDKKEEART